MKDMLTAHAAFEDQGKRIAANTAIHGCDAPIREQLDRAIASETLPDAYSHISFLLGVPAPVQAKVKERLQLEYKSREEGYILDMTEEGIFVYAERPRGLLYGAATLSQLAEDGHVRFGLVYNFPLCPMRGLKIYLPSEDGIPYFKQFVDMLVHYKYNTIVLEVGGAMAYSKHPEINEGWLRYCEEMYEYSGKTVVVQEQTFSWYKNSIHSENGGGGYLPQERVRELVAYCKERHFDVIPEVPSLSHCDYLLINHHEIKERKEDPYPDTYCPSDERSYELLFDVLDEVLDVFEPAIVHIGHDELYSIGLCDKCKGKPAEQIYADDINKIHNYLQDRGVKTMMWSEKLINAITSEGRTYGGAERRMVNYETDEYMGETIPATYKAIDSISRDVMMMHWYWGVERHFEQPFLERGMPLVFGNFDGPEFADWPTRSRQGILGGIISNWSRLKQENLQRNRVLFGAAYSAFLFWRNDYEDHLHVETAQLAFADLYRYNNDHTLRQYGNRGGVSYVEVTHTTDHTREYQSFVDGIYLDNTEYRLGEYVLEYGDGATAGVPIIYGYNISNKNRKWERSLSKGERQTAASYEVDPSLLETAYTTLPTLVGEDTYYRWTIPNPYPDKPIINVKLTVDRPATGNIYVQSLRIVPDPSETGAGETRERIQIRGDAVIAQ